MLVCQLVVTLHSVGQGSSSMPPDLVAAVEMVFDRGQDDDLLLGWEQRGLEPVGYHEW